MTTLGVIPKLRIRVNLNVPVNIRVITFQLYQNSCTRLAGGYYALVKKSDELAAKLHDKLEQIGINHLARHSGFVRREPRKIKPLHFLVGYFITVLCDAFS